MDVQQNSKRHQNIGLPILDRNFEKNIVAPEKEENEVQLFDEDFENSETLK